MNVYTFESHDFTDHEMVVDGNYSYLDKFDDDDTANIIKFYEAVVHFMKNGNLPRHIKDVTLSYYHVFGLTGFFPRDVNKIRNFAGSIVILDFKLRHSQGFQAKFMQPTGDILRDEDNERDMEIFRELVQLCLKLKEKFLDPEAELEPKVPRLF